MPSLSVQESTSQFQSGFFGQPCLHMSRNSGENAAPLDMEVFSADIMREPHKAHVLTASAGIQRPKSTISVRTTVSFFFRRKKAVRPILLRDMPYAGCRTQSHNIPPIKRKPHPFPARPFPHFLQTLCTSSTGRHGFTRL